MAPGSAVRKIPASILTEYRLSYRTRRQRELARISVPGELPPMTGGEGTLLDEVTLDMVASNLDLRAPNKRAVRTIALCIGGHEASGQTGCSRG